MNVWSSVENLVDFSKQRPCEAFFFELNLEQGKKKQKMPFPPYVARPVRSVLGIIVIKDVISFVFGFPDEPIKGRVERFAFKYAGKWSVSRASGERCGGSGWEGRLLVWQALT